MKCPFCKSRDTKVTDSRDTDEGAAIRRRRQCLSCGRRFTTYETVEKLPLRVIKKNGKRELFDRFSSPAILYFCVEFIEITAHAKQKNLQFDFSFPTEQKSLKFIVVFQNPEGSFHLDGTVHPVQNPCLAQDIS